MTWDYLIVTASNERQAAAYELQLDLRRKLGLLAEVREVLVVPDLEGKRIGSGGSTLLCLEQVLAREHSLAEQRVLILHAGGDSRRLPAYGPCGKIFVPIPGPGSRVPETLFDRLAAALLQLPGRKGQVVVAAGDALVQFDPRALRFDRSGITVVGGFSTPEEASRHGVYVTGQGSEVSLYLQKPSIAEQRAFGAIDSRGRTALDVGLMSLDATAAMRLLEAFRGIPRDEFLTHGIDLYREICCALGQAGTVEHFLKTAQGSGSKWPTETLRKLFPALHQIPFFVELLEEARFLHFGSTRQLVESGLALLEQDGIAPPASGTLVVNSTLDGSGSVTGARSWIEGCRISAPLRLGGDNVVIGVDIDEPLDLPAGACIDVLASNRAATTRERLPHTFVRCYGVRDTFKDATLCGRPLHEWLQAAGLEPADVWSDTSEPPSLWNARVFPAGPDFRRWLWMYAPESATDAERRAYREAPRYSSAEIALLADQEAFHTRRFSIHESQRA
jgi:fucokinase